MAWNPFDPYGTNTDYLNTPAVTAPEVPPPPQPWQPTAGMEGVLGGTPIDPQQAAYWASGQGSWGPEYQSSVPYQPETATPPPVQPPPAGFNPVNGEPYGLQNMGELSAPGIPSINLPQPGTINPEFSGGFKNNYTDFMNVIGNQMGQQYGYATPTALASEMQTGSIPQPAAQSFNVSPELQQMLSGQGYDPATLALMRAGATEDASGAGRTEMAQAKRALEQSGLGASPAGAAITGDVARREGMAQTSALRDISIKSAEQGVQNKQFGIGQQTGIGLSNMQSANQMAIENANRLFSGMSQNLANQQQSNMAQYGAEVNKKAEQAATVSGFLGQQGNAFQQASLNKAANSESQTVANQMTWSQQQAELERQRALSNQNVLQSRWTTATTGLPAWSPLPSGNQQPVQGYSPFGS